MKKNEIEIYKKQLNSLKNNLKSEEFGLKDIPKSVDIFNDIIIKLDISFKADFKQLIISKVKVYSNKSFKPQHKPQETLEDELKKNIERCLAKLNDIKEAEQEQKNVPEKKIDEKDQKIAELTDCLQRLQAEFENYKKRVEKENNNFLKYANAGLINELLPLLDSFELALKNKESKEDFIKGVELIFAQLFSTLEKQGLRPIEAEGKPFDPYKHEVMLQEPSDKEGIVLEELQKGYMLYDKVLRHSKVKVGKKVKEENK